MKLFCVSLLTHKAEEGRETNRERLFQKEKEGAIVQFWRLSIWHLGVLEMFLLEISDGDDKNVEKRSEFPSFKSV